ncbi:MAG: hypothetical protein ABIZ81_04730 [Opitutaceae bacterium]
MTPKFWTRSVLTIGTLAMFGVALQQRATNGALRTEASRLQALNREADALRAKNLLLTGHQVSAEELARLREAALEESRLRVEANELRRKAQEAATSEGGASPADAPQPAPEFWTNAGRTTPLAALQSTVWAARQGDTNTLAGLIAFDAAGRALVDALFARLPDESRVLTGSAEKAFATLLAVRLPQDLGSAEVTTGPVTMGDELTLGMRLKRTDGESKEAKLRFAHDAEGWRMVVPAKVVENYIATLSNRIPPRPNSSSILSSPLMVE